MQLTTTPSSFLSSSLSLIRARPSTVKITTTYHHSSTSPDPNSSTSKTRRTKKSSLTLKCYDPVSGACIKFRTNKISDVGRLIGVLNKAARGMGGLPVSTEDGATTTGADKDKDAVMTDAPPGPAEASATLATENVLTSGTVQTHGQTGGGSGKGGRKKRGKK